MSLSINKSQFAKDGIHVTYSDNSTQNLSFADKKLTIDKGLVVSSGGLNATGAAQITGALGVSGLVSLANNLAVTGTTTNTGDVTMNNNLHVVGESSLDGIVTAKEPVTMQKTLGVTGKATLVDLEANGPANMKSTLDVTGVATMKNTLIVKEAATLEKALTVTGAASLDSSLDVTGAAVMKNTLIVKEAATLEKALTVSGAATMSGGATVTGTLATVGSSSVSGASTVGGALTVGGASNLNSNLSVFGTTDLQSTLDVAGAADLQSTLDVAGAADLQSTLDVAGKATLGAALDVTGKATLSAALDVGGKATVFGAADLKTTLDVAGNSTLGGTLGVTGKATLGAALDVTGKATLSDALDVGGKATVYGAADLKTTLDVAGKTTLGAALDVTGKATMYGAADLKTTLDVAGNSTVGGTLGVTGKATVGSLDVTGAVTFSNNLTVNGNLTVLGTQTLLNTTSLEVKDAAILIADGNDASDSISSGIEMMYKPSGSSVVNYAGVKRLPTTGEFVFFKDSASKIDASGSSSRSTSFPITYPNTGDGAKKLTGLPVSSIDGSPASSIDGEWFQYQLPSAIVLSHYQMASYWEVDGITNDFENPYEWYLLASNNGTSWTTIDHQTQQDYTKWAPYDKSYTPRGPRYYNTYAVQNNTTAYQYYRMIVTKTDPLNNTGNNYWYLYAFFLVESGATLTGNPGHEFVATGNIYPEFFLTSANDRGYVTSQSTPDEVWNGISSPGAQYQTAGNVMTGQLSSDNTYYGNPLGIGFYYPNNPTTWSNPTFTTTSLGNLYYDAANLAAAIAYVSSVAPNAKVAVWSGSPTSGPGRINWYVDNNGGWIQLVSGSGLVAIQFAAGITGESLVSAAAADVYATVLADSFNSASDARLKKDVIALDGALGTLDAIRGVRYNWIDESASKDIQVGVIAQEIQSVYPELVREGGNGFLSVDYPKLTAVLIQAVKELKAMVVALANK
jgi:predicted acyltransferase (DUF342 family)